MIKLFLILSFLFVISSAGRWGPQVIATKGEVWPQPQAEQKTDDYFIIRPHAFSFKGPDSIGCPDLLNDAFSRYWSIISTSASLERRGRLSEVGKQHKKVWKNDKSYLGYLDDLTVQILGECAEDVRPEFDDDEDYILTVNSDGANLTADTIWGALRGLETFSQLIYIEDDILVINGTSITDFPRFSYRGLMLDTSRHFQPVYIIYEMLDAMAYNKLNVFHWHIVDDQSFPYKSRVYPDLSEKGAYHPVSKVYEQSDIARIIEYARVRGIRVIPEFDTPGHTTSWGQAYPDLITKCYTNDLPDGSTGPMDPSKNATFEFVNNLFTEVVGVFKDSYFHMGGDEVELYCWESNPEINAFMQENNIATYENLEGYFVQRVVNLLDSLDMKYLVWEEVFVDGVNIPNTTLVHIWKEATGPEVVKRVVEAGKYAIYSACWYLDHLATGGDWQKYYNCDPLDFEATDEQKKLVLGGEACMWTEVVNEHNVVPRVWPRASAAAERLWSDAGVNVTLAKARLEEHVCRMNMRGIAAEPANGPGVCL